MKQMTVQVRLAQAARMKKKKTTTQKLIDISLTLIENYNCVPNSFKTEIISTSWMMLGVPPSGGR